MFLRTILASMANRHYVAKGLFEKPLTLSVAGPYVVEDWTLDVVARVTAGDAVADFVATDRCSTPVRIPIGSVAAVVAPEHSVERTSWPSSVA